MESQRNQLRYSLFTDQDDIDKQKDSLIEEMEKRLKQNIKFEELFYIGWEITTAENAVAAPFETAKISLCNG
jgi:hypothetical protein